jgi:hypothetical protein
VLVFAPLGCAYGVLSMGGNFAPGNSKFCIFWVVAIVLVSVTMGCFWIFWNGVSEKGKKSGYNRWMTLVWQEDKALNSILEMEVDEGYRELPKLRRERQTHAWGHRVSRDDVEAQR